jgi:hypothetical protein
MAAETLMSQAIFLTTTGTISLDRTTTRLVPPKCVKTAPFNRTRSSNHVVLYYDKLVSPHHHISRLRLCSPARGLQLFDQVSSFATSDMGLDMAEVDDIRAAYMFVMDSM